MIWIKHTPKEFKIYLVKNILHKISFIELPPEIWYSYNSKAFKWKLL